jgi:hypothetical protein
MLAGPLRLDAGLAGDEPVHSLVEVVLVGTGEFEEFAQTAGGSVEAHAASSGEFGGRLDDAGDNHGADQIAPAGRSGADDVVQAEGAKRAKDSGDVAVGERASNHERGRGGRGGRGEGFALQDAAEGIDPSLRPMGEVGEGAFDDPGSVTGGFAEENGGRGVAVSDAFHIHG